MTSPSSSYTTSVPIHWKPLGPSNFPNVISPKDGCQYAKDDEYLEAVLDSWKQDPNIARKTAPSLPQPQQVETSPWIYYDDRGTPLYGHMIRPVETPEATDDKGSFSFSSGDPARRRPGILLFHTAAGPHDIFLFQKAATLASSELGCVVLICDILSDRDGWAWKPDRTRFKRVHEELFREKAGLLRSRVEAAVRTLVSGSHNDSVDSNHGSGDVCLRVDPDRIAGLGWCFGAHSLLELTIVQHHHEQDATEGEGEVGGDALTFSASALISYHGVYRREDHPAFSGASTIATSPRASKKKHREVLICTGKSDPFVSPEDLKFAKATMEEHEYFVRIMDFDEAKHGFTNPAQGFNTNPAFQYDENAATKSWEATMELLKRKLM